MKKDIGAIKLILLWLTIMVFASYLYLSYNISKIEAQIKKEITIQKMDNNKGNNK